MLTVHSLPRAKHSRCVFNAFLLITLCITLCIILSNTLILNVYLHFRHLQQRMRDGDSITEGDKWGMDGKKERKQKGDKGDNEAVTSHALPYALLSLAPRFSQLITSISFLGHNKSNLTNKKNHQIHRPSRGCYCQLPPPPACVPCSSI